MQLTIWLFWMPVAVVVGGLAGSIPVFTMGLIVPVPIVGPLAIVTGSLLATLCAGWVANLAVTGEAVSRSRSRIFAIFGVASAAATVALAVGFLAASVANSLDAGLNIMVDLAVYLPGVIVFAAATVVATRKLRVRVDGGLTVEGAIALTLGALWLVFLFFVEGLGYLSGLVPAGLTMNALLGGSIILVVVGGVMFLRRTERRSLNADAALSLVLVGLMPLVVGGIVSLGCLTFTCGP